MSKKPDKSKKPTKALTVKKPNQTISITNGKITATQRKAFNVLLFHTAQQLNQGATKNKFSIPIHKIKKLAGIKTTDDRHFKDQLTGLMRIYVENIKENNDWEMFVLVSDIKKVGDVMVYSLSQTMLEALIDHNYYTTLNLLTIKTLTSKYAIILYELAIRYSKVEIPKFTIDEFKNLMGAIQYRDFFDLKKRVIEPAVAEINTRTDIVLFYQPIGDGRKIIEIKFTVQMKQSNHEPKEFLIEANNGPLVVSDETDLVNEADILDYIENNYSMLTPKTKEQIIGVILNDNPFDPKWPKHLVDKIARDKSKFKLIKSI